MSLLALMAAAAVAAPAATETPNTFALPEHCRTYQRVQRTTPPAPVPRLAFKLGEQPPADMHLLVDRRVNGCPVPTIVRYNVDDVRPVPARREGAPARRR